MSVRFRLFLGPLGLFASDPRERAERSLRTVALLCIRIRRYRLEDREQSHRACVFDNKPNPSV